MTITWEEIKDNHDQLLWRAKVPGGWLVKMNIGILLDTTTGNAKIFESSLCYVPDPLGAWQ